MKIILKKTYQANGIRTIFYSKEDMIDYILDYNHREHELLNDGFDDYCKFNGMSKNLKKWNIYELVNYFFGDYEMVKEK